MTFLAPWALAIGAAGALGVVLLHLVSRHRPAAFVLPTTRFIPDQQTLVSRAATTPSDLLLLLLRVMLLLSAATAFAKPVLTPPKGSVALVIIADRSGAVADPADVASRVKALAARGEHVLVSFDTAASVADGSNPDSMRASAPNGPPGSISGALLLARRAAAALAERSDSVRMVLVSPVAASEVDSATVALRRMWPGAIELYLVALRKDSARAWSLERAIPLSDPLGPALRLRPVGEAGLRTRLVHSALSAADSAFARGGGTVVRWDSSAAGMHAEGLSSGGDVIVSALARTPVPSTGEVMARWADASPAAVQARTGKGCLRQVGIGIPIAGDLPLHPAFQRIARRLLTPCGAEEPIVAADSATVGVIRGTGTAVAASSAVRSDERRVSRLVQVLLGVALACAAAELYVRARTARTEAVAA